MTKRITDLEGRLDASMKRANGSFNNIGGAGQALRRLRAFRELLEASKLALIQIGRCCHNSDGSEWHSLDCATPILKAAIERAESIK